jgi:hypothetical protein
LARAWLLLAVLAAGCGSGTNTVLVRERFEPAQIPNSGATAIDCKLAAVYKVREATGTAFLTQSRLLRLRLHASRTMRPRLDCQGPLVAELPAAATKIEARAGERSLAVRRVRSVRLAPGRALRPRRHTQLVLVDWLRTPPAAYDNYRLELRFELPKAHWLRERIVYTARVACAGSSYLLPVVPLTDGLGWVNAFEIPPDGKPFDFILPRLAGGISSHAIATRRLRCGA